MREAHPNYSYQRSITRKGKKNSIIERDIKILPYLINKGGWLKCIANCWSIIIGCWQIGGGVGAGRRLSLGFDEMKREIEMKGIREKKVFEFGKKFRILCGL